MIFLLDIKHHLDFRQRNVSLDWLKIIFSKILRPVNFVRLIFRGPNRFLFLVNFITHSIINFECLFCLKDAVP